MISIRSAVEATDTLYLEKSLAEDKFHPGVKPAVFFPKCTDGETPDARYMTTAYEDESGPIMYLRGTRVLRIEIAFVNNEDYARNREAMLQGWAALTSNARRNGFTEIVTSTNSPHLQSFAKKVLGFVETNVGAEVELKHLL